MAGRQTESSKNIEAVIAAGAAPHLKLLGYRKAGRRFYILSQDSVAHIRFQASQWNNPDKASFTINLSRYFPAIALKNGDPVEVDPTRQRLMHVGIRIGHLLPVQKDYWWSISSARQVDAVAEDVVAALRDFGLPYLEETNSLEGVAKLSGAIPGILSAPTRSKASALSLLGREAEAQAVLAELSARVSP
jgi:Domain of unknown function (DUF4304)